MATNPHKSGNPASHRFDAGIRRTTINSGVKMSNNETEPEESKRLLRFLNFLLVTGPVALAIIILATAVIFYFLSK